MTDDASDALDGSVLRLRDWWTLRLALIWAYRGEPGSRRTRGTEPVASFVAWRLEAGRVRITSPKGVYHARAGQWLISTDRTGQDFSADARLVSVNFVAHWVDGRPLFSLPEPVVLDAVDHPRLSRAANALARVSPKAPPTRGKGWMALDADTTLGRYLRVRGRFNRFVEAWARTLSEAGYEQTRAGPAMDERVNEAARRIESSDPGEPVDHHALADSLGLSLSQLNRLFVRGLGVTPRAYEQRRRLQLAKRALTDPATPIKQVAYLLGFKQPSHFTAWFGKEAGMTPRAFRDSGLPPDGLI